MQEPLATHRKDLPSLHLPATHTLSSQISSDLLSLDPESLSIERAAEELKGLLLTSERPSLGLNLMRDLGIVKKHFPELENLADTPQDPKWHPEGDVWTHTMMVVDEAASIVARLGAFLTCEEKLALLFGALCHDLGKPLVTEFRDGHIRSHNHEREGEEPARRLLGRINLLHDIQETVVHITTKHMLPGAWYKAFEKGTLHLDDYINNVRMLIRDIRPTGWRIFLAACEADFRGRGIQRAAATPYSAGVMIERLIEENDLEKASKEVLIGEQGLLQLGFEPSPLFEKIIREVETLRDKGALKTSEDALRHVKNKHLVTGRDITELGVEPGPRVGEIVRAAKVLIEQGEISSRAEVKAYLLTLKL